MAARPLRTRTWLELAQNWIRILIDNILMIYIFIILTDRCAMSRRDARRNEATEAGPAADASLSQRPFNRAPVHVARRLSQILLSAVGQAVPPDGARNEFGTLMAILQNPGIDQKRLAGLMVLDATTVGQLVDNLERKGLVRRAASPTDRRVNTLEATEAGREVVAVYRPQIVKVQDEALSVLSDAERRLLIDLMVRVIEANPQHDRPGGGRRSPKPSSG